MPDDAVRREDDAEGSASAEFLALLEGACALCSLTLPELLTRADIGLGAVPRPSERVSIGHVRRAFVALEELSGLSTLGLRLAQQLKPGDFDLLDYLVLSAPTLRDACQLFCRFLPLLADAGSVWLAESGDRALLCHHAEGAVPAISQLMMGGVVSRARRLVDSPARIRQVGFMQPARAPAADYERLLGVPVVFEQIYDTVTFDRAALDLPTSSADANLARILLRQAEEGMARVKAHRPPGDASLRDVAVELVLSGHASLERMAERLGTTTRTLQRRLAAEGLSHRALIESVRAELVESALAQDGKNLSALAQSLGYATPGSLRRARERWLRRTGEGPSA